MRLITDEQHAQIVEAFLYFLSIAETRRQYYDTYIGHTKALTVLQALPEVEAVAWMVTYEHGGGRQERVLSLTEPPKPRFAALAWVTPLYATKDKT